MRTAIYPLCSAWGNPWFPHEPPPSRIAAANTTRAALGPSPAPPTNASLRQSLSSLLLSLLQELRRRPRPFAFLHLLHHLLHLLAGREQLVDLLDRGAAARRDPLAAGAVDQVRDGAPLPGRPEDRPPAPAPFRF